MIRLFIPAPQGIEFTEWGTLVAEQLAAYGVQAPANNDAWIEWGSNLLHEPQLGLAPAPQGFGDWRDWASSFRSTFG
jgi:hypothetical protein